MATRRAAVWGVLALLLGLLVAPQAVGAALCTPLTDNYHVTATVTFCGGSASFQDREAKGVIIIDANSVTNGPITVDGGGMTLGGKNSAGYGIRVSGVNPGGTTQNVVKITNFTISKYYDAIRIDNSTGITVQNVAVSNNGGVAQQNYDIHRGLAQEYGGGILLSNGTGYSIFDRVVGSGENVGIDLYNSTNNTITNSDFSDNYGWGIRLSGSSGNTIGGGPGTKEGTFNNLANRVAGCRGRNCSARDTAGVLLVDGSNDNIISYNKVQYGGDGVFLGNGAPNSTSSDRNIFSYNDGSYAIHNAFEATFSSNTFTNNIASNSAYGFWLGYSYNTTVTNNTIQNNGTDGLNWDMVNKGQGGVGGGTVTGNRITGNGRYGLAFTHSEAGTSVVGSTQQIMYNSLAGNADNLYVSGITGVAASHNNLVCGYAGKTCQYNAYSTGVGVDASSNYWDPATFKVFGPITTSSPLPSADTTAPTLQG